MQIDTIVGTGILNNNNNIRYTITKDRNERVYTSEEIERELKEALGGAISTSESLSWSHDGYVNGTIGYPVWPIQNAGSLRIGCSWEAIFELGPLPDSVGTVPVSCSGKFPFSNNYQKWAPGNGERLSICFTHNADHNAGSGTIYTGINGWKYLKFSVNGGTLYVLFIQGGGIRFWLSYRGWFYVVDASAQLKGASKYDIPVNIRHDIIAASGYLQGICYDASENPAPFRKIYFYERSNGIMVAQTESDAHGNYFCMCSAVPGSMLFGVCLDDDSTPYFESVVVDRIEYKSNFG